MASLLVLLIGSSFASKGIYGWGYSYSNELSIPSAQVVDAAAVAAGGGHALALMGDGTVVGWGDNWAGQATVPAGLTGVVAIAAGSAHSLALKSDGTVVAWGWDYFGQTEVPAGLDHVVAIAAGLYNNLVLKDDGTVVAWGWNSFGQGDVPPDLTDVKAICCGAYHSMALKNDGTVVAWGFNGQGQTSVPADLTGVVGIAAGERHSLALKSDGTVVAWGYNSNGQSTVPAGLSNVSKIVANASSSGALRSDGTLVLWGSNYDGEGEVPQGLQAVSDVSLGGSVVMVLAEDQPLVSYSRRNVVGGSTTGMTGTLRFIVPTGSNRTASLISGDPSLTLTPSVTVPAGSLSANFSVGHTRVASATTVPVSCTAIGFTNFSSVDVLPFAVTAVKLKGSGMYGGNTASATVSFNAAPRAPLSYVPQTGNSAVAAVPSTGTLAANSASTSFPISTFFVPSNTSVNIGAQVGTTPAVSAPLTVLAPPQVVSVTVPATFGHQHLLGTIKLNTSALADQTITLTADPCLHVPATVTVPKGQISAKFDIVTDDVATTTTAQVTASNPYSAVGCQVTVRPLLPDSLFFWSPSVTGGTSVTATAVLARVVAVDTVVTIVYPASYISGPTTVTVPAGSNSVSFTVDTTAVGRQRTVTLSATKNGKTVRSSLVITP